MYEALWSVPDTEEILIALVLQDEAKQRGFPYPTTALLHFLHSFTQQMITRSPETPSAPSRAILETEMKGNR